MPRNPARQFRAGVHEKLKHYVYRLADPSNGETFYVGKGVGNRVFDHFSEADRLPSDHSEKIRRIQAIWERNTQNDVEVIIHRHGLTEDEAFLIESVLIDLLPSVLVDTDVAGNKVRGHGAAQFGAKDVVALDHQYAALGANIEVPMALIKINKRWNEYCSTSKSLPMDTHIFEMTRGSWAVQPRNHPQVKYAAAVAFGLVREVFTIEDWTNKDDAGRVTFHGKVSPDFRHLVGSHVNDIFDQGAQNPVRWYYPRKEYE